MLRPALAALLALALLPGAAAFDASPGGPHDDATRAAARVAGFPEGGVDALVAAARSPDGAGDPPERHCDRVPGVASAAAFNATVAYVRGQGGDAANATLAGDSAAAVRALGRALHALEDCFSHSNAVDFAEPTAVVHAVVGQAPPPEGLVLTGYLPGADDPAMPPDDPYPRGQFAKESADANNESRAVMPDNRTKFEAARDLATDAASLFLQEWLAARNPAEVGPLGDVEAPAGGVLPRWSPAPVGLALGAGLLAVAAASRRSR
jgi:hypothetical protein